MTPRVPWTPTDVMQILLAWILAILIGQIAYGLFVPAHIEGRHRVSDGNQSIEVTFLPDNRYKTDNDSGEYHFEGEQPHQNRNTIIFKSDNGCEFARKFIGTTRDRVGIIAVNLVFVQGSVVIMIMLLLFKYRLKWKDAFGGLGNPAQTIALPCLLGSLFLFPAFLLHSVSHFIIIKMGGDPSTQQAVQMVSAAENHAEIALQAFSVVFMAPVAEELLFRGVIYSSIKQIGYQRAAIAISAILFAAVHSSWALMLPLIVLACILVWLYEKTGSLFAPMVMHATFNAINFMLIKFSPQLFQ